MKKKQRIYTAQDIRYLMTEGRARAQAIGGDFKFVVTEEQELVLVIEQPEQTPVPIGAGLAES